MDRAAGIEDSQAREARAEARFQLRQTVKLAKRNYYRNLIEGLDYHAIFRAVGWATSQRQYTTPHIKRSDGSLATANIAKQQALRETILTPTEGIGQDASAVDLSQEERNDIPETHMCNEEEAEYAISRMGNSSAGEDEIPPGVIKKAWPVLKKHITSFFGMCLRNGHHPQCFKSAILCALPKPEKKIRSEPKSYRLIALLSCLGKVLERVVARRLSTFTLKAKLFSNLHFGAIPGRSAVDAAATLTHDVEKAMQQQNVVTALAFDIKVAFDNVSKDKLIKRLWDQKISLLLIRWTDSFLTQQTAAIRLDGKTGIQQTLGIGVP